jgi:hypothetical protein
VECENGLRVSTDVEHDLHEQSHRIPLPPPSSASAYPATMSKLSTSEIIAQGDYLEADFNPASLTIPQLLGILGYHGVNYPSQHPKAKLVQLFNDEIKAKADQYKAERLSRQNSQASDEGIKDGITGEALNAGQRVCSAVQLCLLVLMYVRIGP